MQLFCFECLRCRFSACREAVLGIGIAGSKRCRPSPDMRCLVAWAIFMLLFRQNFAVASAPILRQNKSAALEHNPGRRFSLSQNRRRARGGRSPFAFSSYPAACRLGRGDFASENPISPPTQIVSLQFPRPEIRRISTKTGGNGRRRRIPRFRQRQNCHGSN